MWEIPYTYLFIAVNFAVLPTKVLVQFYNVFTCLWLVTNNNGFWTGWLDLLTPSFTVTLSQSITALSLIYPFHKSLGHAPFSFSFFIVLLSLPSYNSSARTPRKTPSSLMKNACLLVRYLGMDICEQYRKHLFFYCCNHSALHSTGSYPIVACVFVAAGMYLPSRCLATYLYVTLLSIRFTEIFTT
jgi:hypothetical protein